MRATRVRDDRDRGQVLILFAVSSIVLLGMVALALDVGYLLGERRQAQSSADAAALAGARRLMNTSDVSDVADNARNYVDANGVELGGTGGATAEVQVDGNSRSGAVTVDLSVPVSRFFIGAVYTGDWEVSAHAVARIFDDKNGQYALLALEPPGIYVNGNITIDVLGGSAMSNGDVDRSGGVNTFTVDGTIDAVGFVNPNSNWEAPGGFHGMWAEAVDPLAGAQPPNSAGLPEIESDELPDCWSADCTLEPGYYPNLGKIRIKHTATLIEGTYYFSGTSLDLQDDNSRIEGDGVVLYFDGPVGSTYFDPKTGEVDLRAAESSPYPGGPDHMIVWIANCSEFESLGNAEFYVEGIFYAPCSDVTMHGTPMGTAVSGQLIVGTLDVRGTSDFIVQYEDLVMIPRIELFLVE